MGWDRKMRKILRTQEERVPSTQKSVLLTTAEQESSTVNKPQDYVPFPGAALQFSVNLT